METNLDSGIVCVFLIEGLLGCGAIVVLGQLHGVSPGLGIGIIASTRREILHAQKKAEQAPRYLK